MGLQIAQFFPLCTFRPLKRMNILRRLVLWVDKLQMHLFFSHIAEGGGRFHYMVLSKIKLYPLL